MVGNSGRNGVEWMSSVRSGRAALAVAAVLLLTGLSGPEVVRAAGFHKYSVARETSGANHYTGLKVTRTDPYFQISAGQNCFAPYTAPVIYQSQWIIMTSDWANWVELGTADQCNGYQYLYWGYGTSSGWHSLGVAATPGSGSHVFDVHRVSGNTYRYYVDGTLKGSLSWTRIGWHEQVGTESYDQYATASKHTYGSMSRAIDQGSWVLWAGFDDWSVDTPEMCGGWDTASQWRASENATC
jgi:hypothetical protein